MKHRTSHFLPALIVVFLVLSPFQMVPARAQSAALTPDEIRAAIDARLAQLWGAIQTKEANYFAAHGHYWQGLRTNTLLPADGALVIADIGARTPTDQPDPWPALALSTGLPMAITIDVYDGPEGIGYVATVTVTIVGRTWARSAQEGPEKWRVEGWHDISQTETP